MSALKTSRYLRRCSLLLVSLTAIGLGGCGTGSPIISASPSEETQRLKVITTFIPVTNFTKAVAGDRAEVTQLLPTNVGPHDYQAKPEDVQKLARGNVLVKNGLGMEEFLGDLLKNAGNANLKLIDSSKDIQPIANEEKHDHDHEKTSEAGHNHGAFNPHIYLDPKRAIKQVENIRDGLIAADPEGKTTYNTNATAYIEKLKQLDGEIAQKLQPFAGKTFVTYHDFAPYFAQSYNLKAEFLVDVPEENASPEDVKRVINAAKQSNLKTLLTESQAVGSPFAALAKDLKVKVSTFDPLETSNGEALRPDYYLTTMRQNLQNLESAFSGQTQQSLLPIISPRTLLMIQPQSLRLSF
ncbi:MAG: zinc ABC transporter substrate-binding protein [Woronichinia naegeliana WA131]|jgi:zinc/manganese transport system substrate-binding protein|uniref:Zinc ABC transporter substrate-binding protein n=1 Tax=Woronichinia naegeliana WA131 TaxID=2824559 RepID=A0A977KTZ3_9CYAN|nr:MAG: zinc ABC transporter substrate-binding protein [Woronichinia naegeliana WA131]